jgi:hypothetical protein
LSILKKSLVQFFEKEKLILLHGAINKAPGGSNKKKTKRKIRLPRVQDDLVQCRPAACELTMHILVSSQHASSALFAAAEELAAHKTNWNFFFHSLSSWASVVLKGSNGSNR